MFAIWPFTETFADPWTKINTSPHFSVNKFVKLISEKNATEPWVGGGGGCLGEV